MYKILFKLDLISGLHTTPQSVIACVLTVFLFERHFKSNLIPTRPSHLISLDLSVAENVLSEPQRHSFGHSGSLQSQAICSGNYKNALDSG